MKQSINIHKDFFNAFESVYKSNNLFYTDLKVETENQEYGACTFNLNGKTIKFRVAKKTPKKMGLFVTFWKRLNSGSIAPFDISDDFDFLIVSARDKECFGQFIFPKNVLYEKGVLSKKNLGGKRAIRIYLPCNITQNIQAQKTQLWQSNYFLKIDCHNCVNNTKIKILLSQITLKRSS